MENVANSRNYLTDYYTFKDLGLKEWAKENKLSPNKKAIILKGNQPLINSADYGSYQARKRAISGEIISKEMFIIPRKTHSNIDNDGLLNWNTLGKLLTKIPRPNLKESKRLITDPIYNDIKIKLNDLTDHFYDSGLYKSEWKQSKEHKINHYCMGKMSFPENLNKPSRTITATKSGTSREALIYKSDYKRKGNGEYRTPTVREAASIMGFPYTYQFLGTINSKWRLVGNAVCPSVSKSLASSLLNELKIKSPENLILSNEIDLNEVNNLNDFKEKLFNNQPKRNKSSRFRRHPIKTGNLTVTLSNFDIEKNDKAQNKWFTSIQYGTGKGYKNQKIEDGFYKTLESVIKKDSKGKEFIRFINNGFSEKIGSKKDLQRMYEKQLSEEGFLEPTELVTKVKDIINKYKPKKSVLHQKEHTIFKYKEKVPKEQLLALYAINKISTVANNKK